MITGMDRLAAAIAGRAADRIPVFCNLLEQGAAEVGVSMRAFYQSPDLVAEAQLKMQARYGHDNVWSLMYVGKEAEMLGCRDILYADDGPPNVADFILKSPDDIDRLTIPDDLFDHPGFADSRRCTEILRAEVGGKTPICAYVTASMSLPALLMGMDKWLELLLMGPFDLRDRLLAKCSDFFIREIDAYRKAGADILVYSNPFGSTELLPMAMIRDLAMPWMERDLAPGGVDGVVYYCGSARFNKVIDLVIERLGIRAFYLSPLDDVAAGKKAVAGRGLTFGVIDDIKMVGWSGNETRAEVRRLIKAGKPGGRFGFGTLLMPLAIPERSIQIMLDAALEAGAQDEGEP